MHRGGPFFGNDLVLILAYFRLSENLHASEKELVGQLRAMGLHFFPLGFQRAIAPFVERNFRASEIMEW
jgi:hypothetical protein